MFSRTSCGVNVMEDLVYPRFGSYMIWFQNSLCHIWPCVWGVTRAEVHLLFRHGSIPLERDDLLHASSVIQALHGGEQVRTQSQNWHVPLWPTLPFLGWSSQALDVWTPKPWEDALVVTVAWLCREIKLKASGFPWFPWWHIGDLRFMMTHIAFFDPLEQDECSSHV